MAWSVEIPPLPDAIQVLVSMRQEAGDAWDAAHTLLCAIPAWHEWLSLSRIQYSAGNDYDDETGDEICRAGENAIRELCSLGLRDSPFSGNDAEANLLHFWPDAPSDCLVPARYVSKEDPETERQIGDEFFHNEHILQSALLHLCDLLKTNPRRAFIRQIKLSPAEKDLLEAIRSIGPDADRSQTAIFDWLSGRGKVPSSGTTKTTLSAMKRHGILVEDSEGQYALPEW